MFGKPEKASEMSITDLAYIQSLGKKVDMLSTQFESLERRYYNQPDIPYIKERLRELETNRINVAARLNKDLVNQEKVDEAVGAAKEAYNKAKSVENQIESVARGVAEARNDMIDEVNELQSDVRKKIEVFVEDFTKIWQWQKMVTEKMFGMERTIHSMLPELPESEQEKIRKALKDAGYTQFDVEFVNKNAKPCEKGGAEGVCPEKEGANIRIPNISSVPIFTNSATYTANELNKYQ